MQIFLVDRDVVEYHNLNRQLLFSKEDIGKSKVERYCLQVVRNVDKRLFIFSAAKGLQQHNLNTEIVPLHFDAVKEWGKVVELAKQSTCIFNGIDYGDYWYLLFIF
jgi:molybdopterin/thiamine biosynthesis adenylyltransferase